MARSRNIKPQFFENDLLAEVEPIGRLLFIGLWQLADRRGNLKYRPRHIQGQLFPFESVDVQAQLAALETRGFIRFYTDTKQDFIHIPNFLTHQNPHHKEPAKDPDIADDGILIIDLKKEMQSPGHVSDMPDSDRAVSCFLNPVSCLPLTDDKKNSITTNNKNTRDDQHNDTNARTAESEIIDFADAARVLYEWATSTTASDSSAGAGVDEKMPSVETKPLH